MKGGKGRNNKNKRELYSDAEAVSTSREEGMTKEEEQLQGTPMCL